MNNQRFFLYIALAFVTYLIWLTWEQEHATQSVQKQFETQTESTKSPEINSTDIPDAPVTESFEQAKEEDGVKSNNSTTRTQKIRVTTDVLDVVIDTRGGDIRQLDLPTYPVSLKKKDEPFRLFYSNSLTYIAQSGLRHDNVKGKKDTESLAPSHYDIYTSKSATYSLQDDDDEVDVKLTWHGDNNIKVEKIFTFYRNSFVFDVTHRVINNGPTTWVGRQYQQLRHSPIPGGRSWLRLPTYTGTAYFDGSYHKHSFDDVNEEPISISVTGGWVAMLQHYFVSSWVADENEDNRFYSKSVNSSGEKQLLIGMISNEKTVLPNSSVEFKRRIFAGPKLQHQMEKVAKGLDLSVDYGMFSILSKPLFWLLEWFHKLVGNWGFAIILVTVVVKLVFYKLSEASYKSMARMRKVQPRFQALRERYADDKSKLNQAVMEMYKKEKINPLGGCLPILVQMPVFLALYWVLVESVELRQAPFIFWIQDLSIRDPIFVLPLLMGVSMYIQFKLNPTPPDPMQAKIFAMMPIMMTAFMAFFPAGLVLYWTMNNILSISQQYVITKRIEKGNY